MASFALCGQFRSGFVRGFSGRECLFVQLGTQDGNGEMREIRSAFVKLQPADHAMIGKILGYFRFGDFEVFRKARLDGVHAAAIAAAYQVANGNSQRLAGFDIVVRGQVGICQNEDSWSCRSTVGFVQLCRRASEQAAKLHFEQRNSRRKTRIAIASFGARPRFPQRFHGQVRNRTAMQDSLGGGVICSFILDNTRCRFGSLFRLCKAPRWLSGRFACSWSPSAVFSSAATAPPAPPSTFRRAACVLLRGLLNFAGNRYGRLQRFRISFKRQLFFFCSRFWRDQVEFCTERRRFLSYAFSETAAKPHSRLLRFVLPFRAPEFCGSRGIPLCSIGILPRTLKQFRKLERDHRVARLLIQIGELSRGVFPRARAADARGDLFPIGHILSRIVSAYDLDGQETPRPSGA